MFYELMINEDVDMRKPWNGLGSGKKEFIEEPHFQETIHSR